jgi:hypothetical protein
VLTLGLWTVLAQGEEFRYRYVSLDDKAPPGFDFFSPNGINDSGEVSGTVFNCDDVSCFDTHVAIYKDGTVTALQPGNGGPINAGHTIGGSVELNPDPNLLVQAALFKGNQVELIPSQPSEIFAGVFALNDSGAALVDSFDDAFNETYVLYQNGQANVLDFGPTVTNPRFISFVTTGRFINNKGVIAGTTTTDNILNGASGFRFDPRTGEAALLKPVSPDTLAWGLEINNCGDVLGYSFVRTAPYHEHIGVWDRTGNFKIYFTQTFSSNALLFNDNNLIVITLARGNNSYLVPKPGVRLNLADLVENLPSEQNLRYIFDINNHGDLLGFGSLGSFLLERVDATGLVSSTAPTPSADVKNDRRPIPPAAMAMPRRHIPPTNMLKSGSALPQAPWKDFY